jgi:hypothetical protein
MSVKALALTLALCFAGTVSLAQALHMGTWKLNEDQSKIPPNAMKNTTVMYEAAGDDIKITTDGTDAKGNPLHTEWTGKFDGKPYPVTGDSTADTRTYTLVSEHALTFQNKKGGKVVLDGSVTVSSDGKTRTVNTTGPDASGQNVASTAVYDKQ